MKKILLILTVLFSGVYYSYAQQSTSDTECEGLIAKFFFNSNNASVNENDYRTMTQNINFPLSYTEGVVGQAILASPSAKRFINFSRVIDSKFVPTILPKGDEPRSVTLWYKNLDEKITANYVNFFSYGDSSPGKTFGAYASKQGNIYFQGYGNGNDFATESSYDLSNWLHLAYTYDGTTAKIYVNGVESASREIELATGSTNYLYFLESNGAFDDVRIYNRTLSADEVQGIYEEPEVADFCASPPGFDCSKLLTKLFFNLHAFSEGNNNTFAQSVNQIEPILFNTGGRVGYAITVHEASLREVHLKQEVNGEVVSVNLPSGSEERTVSLWIKYNGGTSGSEIKILQYGSESILGNFGIYFSNQGKIFFRSEASGRTLESPNAYNLTEWTHVAVVVTPSQTVQLFVNGVGVNTGIVTLNTTASTSFQFGGFRGYVDDLRVYKKALTPENIQDLYVNPEVAGFCDQETSVIPVFSDKDAYVYPNPATDIINLKGIENTTKYSIVDIAGRAVMNGIIDDSNATIDVSRLIKGYYFVRLDNQSTYNFIKQ